MGVLFYSGLSVALIIFLVGFFFTGKGLGQGDCENKPASQQGNYIGGIVGIVIGVIAMILISLFMSEKGGKAMEAGKSAFEAGKSAFK